MTCSRRCCMDREALLFNTHQTRDNRGNLIGQRKDGGLYYLYDGLGSVVAITTAPETSATATPTAHP